MAVVKRCPRCGETKPLAEFGKGGQAYYCLACVRWYSRDYARRNPEARTRRKRRLHQASKAKVFAHYGQACACCGTTENLTIDHIAGDGASHRRELFGDSDRGHTMDFYRWLIRNGLPEGYQTLCRRCNTSKGTTDRCQMHDDRPPPVCPCCGQPVSRTRFLNLNYPSPCPD
jgi:hypothetical protein